MELRLAGLHRYTFEYKGESYSAAYAFPMWEVRIAGGYRGPGQLVSSRLTLLAAVRDAIEDVDAFDRAMNR